MHDNARTVVADEIRLLVAGINVKLEAMDAEHALAHKAMSIKPDLRSAKLHAQKAHDAILTLAELILRGEQLGVQQPIAVTDRINQRYDQVLVIFSEINVCEDLLARREVPKPGARPAVLN